LPPRDTALEFYLRHGYWEAKDTHDDLDDQLVIRHASGTTITIATPNRTHRIC